MGRPANKKRSARRPGKRERARIKKPRRMKMWRSDWGAGTGLVKVGRKKSKALIHQSVGRSKAKAG